MRGTKAIKPLFQQGPSLGVRVVLAIIASIALMGIDHTRDLVEPLRGTLSATMHPVRVVASLPSTLTETVGRQLQGRRELMTEINRLRDQQLLNEARLQKLDSLEVENIRLRELLDSSYEVEESVLIAELIQVDMDPYTHIIEVDKGSRSGVNDGQAVLDANGIIGQVDRSSPFSSTVRLVTDASHAIPVQINRSGVRSVAVGTGNLKRLEITGLPNSTDIREGDLLISSGLGGRFPAGYPVARVSSVEFDPGQPFASVSAVPTGAIDRIQEVLLVRRDPEGQRIAGSSDDSSQEGRRAGGGEPSS